MQIQLDQYTWAGDKRSLETYFKKLCPFQQFSSCISVPTASLNNGLDFIENIFQMLNVKMWINTEPGLA